MAKRWEENFDPLLNWLDPDRDRAGVKYEEIRESLINIFSWRGFKDAEDLADETISRVATKVHEIAKEYKGLPALYFYGVAKNVSFEAHRRDKRLEELPPTPYVEPPKQIEDEQPEYECLDQCLDELPASDRELILLYYQQEEPQIRQRKELAKRLKLTLNGIRIRTFRIRVILYACIGKCVETNRRNGSGQKLIIPKEPGVLGKRHS